MRVNSKKEGGEIFVAKTQNRLARYLRNGLANVLDLKNIKPVTELSLNEVNSRLGTGEERISDLEDRLVKIIQTKVHRGQKVGKQDISQ